MPYIKWKKYLNKKGLYSGDLLSNKLDIELRTGMRLLEKIISNKAPAIKGMIWRKGDINTSATIEDVDRSLSLLSLGQATLDELGSPNDPDHFSGPINQMFITQEQSKISDTSPRNQSSGAWQSDIPKNKSSKTPTKTEEFEDITNLVNLIENSITNDV